MMQTDLFSGDENDQAGGSAPTALPYRLQPLPASDDIVERMNGERGLRGAEQFEPAEQALARLAQAKAPSLSRMLSWAHHPDERVAVALAARKDVIGGSGRTALTVKAALTLRAIRSLEHEGVLWNPLVDQVAAAQNWGRSGSRSTTSPRPTRRATASREPAEQREALLDDAVRDLHNGDLAEQGRLKGTTLIYRHLYTGGTLSRRHIDALLAALKNNGGKAEYCWSGTPRADARGILTCHLVLPTLTAADLRELLNYSEGAFQLERLAHAKGADASVWAAVLQANSSPVLRQSLAKHKPALEAPEVVGVLARSSQKAVAMAALQAAGPRDFAAAFRTVAAHDPAYAIAVLEERIDALASVLRPDDIAPLLDIADESLRLRAIGLLRALRAPRSASR